MKRYWLDYLNLTLDPFEGFIMAGVGMALYYFLNILVLNGHFCPKEFVSVPVNDIYANFTKIRLCRSNYTSSEDNSMDENSVASIFILLANLIMNLGSVFFGFLYDRFRPLFIRLLIVSLFLIGFLFLSFLNFENEIPILTVSVVILSSGVGMLFIDLIGQAPHIIPRLEQFTRTILTGEFLGTGWFYWLISNYLMGQESRFSKPNFFWNITNICYIFIGVTICISGTRTLFYINWNNEKKEVCHLQIVSTRNVFDKSLQDAKQLQDSTSYVKPTGVSMTNLKRRLTIMSTTSLQSIGMVIGYRKATKQNSLLSLRKANLILSIFTVGYVVISCLIAVLTPKTKLFFISSHKHY